MIFSIVFFSTGILATAATIIPFTYDGQYIPREYIQSDPAGVETYCGESACSFMEKNVPSIRNSSRTWFFITMLRIVGPDSVNHLQTMIL